MKIFETPTVVRTVPGHPRKLTLGGVTLPGDLWLTEVQGGLEPNYQLLPSLGSEVYLNAFNDKLTQWVLSGYYAHNLCVDGSANLPPYLQLYRAGNIVEGSVVTVSYSDIVLKGFFVKLVMQSNSKDPQKGDTFRLVIIGKVQDAQ